MAPTMLEEELCKRIQHCCATLRRSRNKRNVGSCRLKSLTGLKLCATTGNNMQQGVQTDATCNIQQCWELLVNNVASVCTQPKAPGKRTQHCWPTTSNTVGCYMLRPFAHLVACCWELLHPFGHYCQHGRNNSQHC